MDESTPVPARSPGGFSWFEALASGAAAVLLAGILAPAVLPPPHEAQNDLARARMAAIARAYHAYFVDTGRWPTWEHRAEGLLTEELPPLPCLQGNVHELPGWSGPYLDPQHRSAGFSGGPPPDLRDPWGRSFLVHQRPPGPEAPGALLLISRGADGRLETTGEHLLAVEAGGDDVVYAVARSL